MDVRDAHPITDAQPGQRWTAVQVFGDDSAHHGGCCECCGGYCPIGEFDHRPGVEVLYEVYGYLSDRFVAIRGDLIDLRPEEEPMKLGRGTSNGWTVPDEKPGPSTATFVASRALRLTDLGIDICDGGPGKTPQHLYLGDDHIGYLMPATRGRTLAECAELRRVGQALDADRGKAWELMVHLPMENVDALAALIDVGHDLRQMLGADR